MRYIQGFICVAATIYHENQFILFGKNISQRKQIYQNFETNDFTPFDNRPDIELASVEILKIPDIQDVVVAHIKMQIAENEKEIYKFENKKNLVVIGKLESDTKLFGKLIDDYPTYLSASLFTLNGLIHFDSFEIAIQSIRQINRQTQSGATIASLEIEKIGK